MKNPIIILTLILLPILIIGQDEKTSKWSDGLTLSLGTGVSWYEIKNGSHDIGIGYRWDYKLNDKFTLSGGVEVNKDYFKRYPNMSCRRESDVLNGGSTTTNVGSVYQYISSFMATSVNFGFSVKLFKFLTPGFYIRPFYIFDNSSRIDFYFFSSSRFCGSRSSIIGMQSATPSDLDFERIVNLEYLMKLISVRRNKLSVELFVGYSDMPVERFLGQDIERKYVKCNAFYRLNRTDKQGEKELIEF